MAKLCGHKNNRSARDSFERTTNKFVKEFAASLEAGVKTETPTKTKTKTTAKPAPCKTKRRAASDDVDDLLDEIQVKKQRTESPPPRVSRQLRRSSRHDYKEDFDESEEDHDNYVQPEEEDQEEEVEEEFEV